MPAPASGARTLLGFQLERQIPGSQLGCPYPIITAIPAPAAPDCTNGAGTGVTGVGTFKMAAIYAGRGETAASATGSGVAVEDGSYAVTAPLADESGGLVCIGRRFYRDVDSGGFFEVLTIWDNTTTAFDDATPLGKEGKRRPRSGTTGANCDQTGANFGFQFIRPDNGSDFQRDDTNYKSTEQTGRLGESRAIPGLVNYAHTLNTDLRAGTVVALLASMTGKPTVTQAAGAPAFTYDFPLSDLEKDSVSLSAIFHKGGDLRPLLFGGIKTTEMGITYGEKGQAKLQAKLMGAWDSEAAFGKKTAGTGTFASAPVARGVRSDANRYTDSVFVKVIAAPAVSGGIGSFTIRAALAAAGGTPTFGTAVTSKVYYDPTTKRQCHPAAIGATVATRNQSAWVELYDSTSGLTIGIDDEENRKPFLIYFPGDVSLLAANDVYEIKALQPVPGIYSTAHPTGPADDGSYTGQAPRQTLTTRFAPTHVTIMKGPDSASTDILRFQAGNIKISRPADPVNECGPEAANPSEVDVFGKFKIELDVDRRLNSRVFERLMKENGRLYTVLTFEGSRIKIDTVTGTLAAEREAFNLVLAQSRIESLNSPLAGDKVYVEKMKISPEQPDDEDFDVVSPTVTTFASWDFSRI